MNTIGCGPSFAPYVPFAGAGYPGFAGGSMMGPMNMGYNIIGAAADPNTPPATDQSMTDKAKAWLGEQTFGVKRGYLLGAAVAVGAIWYANHEGWL